MSDRRESGREAGGEEFLLVGEHARPATHNKSVCGVRPTLYITDLINGGPSVY